MPRPRVHSDRRVRAARACVPCKTSKKRCDAKLPCLSCVTKGRTELCQYPLSSPPTSPNRRSGQIRSVQSPDFVTRNVEPQNLTQLRSESQPSLGEDNVQFLQQDINAASAQHPPPLVAPLISGDNITPITSTHASTRESSPCQRSTMLQSSQGEQGRGHFFTL